MGRAAIVLGGAGFIASRLSQQVIASGGFTSADVGVPRFQVAGIDDLQVDERQPESDDLCPGVGEVDNTAAVLTAPGYEFWEYNWTNGLGAFHACDDARLEGPAQIVFTSYISFRGLTKDLKDEDSALSPESACGCSELCAEKIHQQWEVERPGERRLVVVRPALIHDHTKWGHFTLLAGLLRGSWLVFPIRKNGVKNYGYVKVLQRSMRFMREHCTGVNMYSFCHQRRYTTPDLSRSFSRIGGFLPVGIVLTLGPMPFEVLAKIGVKTSINWARVMKLVRSNNIVTKRLLDAGLMHNNDLNGSQSDWKKDPGRIHLDGIVCYARNALGRCVQMHDLGVEKLGFMEFRTSRAICSN